MAIGSLSLTASVFLPLFGSLLIPITGLIYPRLKKAAAMLLGAASIYFLIRTAYSVNAGTAPSFTMALPLGFSLSLQADYLSSFMALTAASISFIIIFYSLGYIPQDEHESEYYTMVLMFLGAMMGLVFSVNLIWMFVFWEITAICSWRLVGFYRSEQDVLKANKTFLVTVFGAVCMLLGIVAVYVSKGTVDLNALKGDSIPDIAVILILLGIFSKSAMLPFSTWLPDAGVAPSTVTSLLHAAVLVKIGVYAYARIFCATLQYDPSWSLIVLSIACMSSLVSAGAALVETNIKRIIAYSTISQIGFIFLGLASNNKIAFAGALLYILMHGVAKGGLFLCAGIIEHKAHTKDITKMGGLFSVMPITAMSFAFCMLSVMGIPPFGGFFSKLMVFRGAVAADQPILLGFYLFSAVLTVIYLLRLFYAVFLGEPKNIHADEDSDHEASFPMVSSVAILGTASLLLGIFIYYPAKYVDLICSGLGVILP